MFYTTKKVSIWNGWRKKNTSLPHQISTFSVFLANFTDESRTITFRQALISDTITIKINAS